MGKGGRSGWVNGHRHHGRRDAATAGEVAEAAGPDCGWVAPFSSSVFLFFFYFLFFCFGLMWKASHSKLDQEK